MPEPSRPAPNAVKLLLCHRRKLRSTRRGFQRRWADEAAGLALEGRELLGFARYAQIHQVGRLDPLYRGIVASRSRLATGLVAEATGTDLPAHEEGSWEWRLERWDVVEEFWFDDRERMLAAWDSPAGRDLAERMVTARTGLVERTAVIAGPEYIIASSEPTYPAARVMFCLAHKPGQSLEAMFDHWLLSHGPLAASLQPDLRYEQYDQLHLDPSSGAAALADRLGASDVRRYDGMASLTYADERHLLTAFLGAPAQKANLQLIEDEFRFVDGQKLGVVLGRQSMFFEPGA